MKGETEIRKVETEKEGKWNRKNYKQRKKERHKGKDTPLVMKMLTKSKLKRKTHLNYSKFAKRKKHQREESSNKREKATNRFLDEENKRQNRSNTETKHKYIQNIQIEARLIVESIAANRKICEIEGKFHREL